MHTVVKISAVLATFAAFGGQAFAQAPPPPPAHQGLFSKMFHHPKPGMMHPGMMHPGMMPTHSMHGGMMHGGMMHGGMMHGNSPMSHGSMMSGASPMSGGFIGNKNSHVYHMPGDKGAMPSPQNRVYFHSAAEAEAAGYHVAGGGAHMHSAHMHSAH